MSSLHKRAFLLFDYFFFSFELFSILIVFNSCEYKCKSISMFSKCNARINLFDVTSATYEQG